ncbi:MAG: class I SAM-dependent RNA methyltransferase [Deltaproteobacteria bacterium]|nr:class I SAM-dependent RNA methyltransferase [Deltaproteobacteria bacterium]
MRDSRTDFKAGDILELEITGIDLNFRGTADSGEIEFIVPESIPGDVCLVQIESISRHHPKIYAKILEFRRVSKDHAVPHCSFYSECKSCNAMHFTAESRVRFKRELIKRYMKTDADFFPSPEQKNWRRKAKFFCKDISGQTVMGSYIPGSHDLFPITQCNVLSEGINSILREISVVISDIPSWNESSSEGILRSIFLREGQGKILVTFVLASSPDENTVARLKSLESVNLIAGVSVNINSEKTNRLLGKTEFLIFGEDALKIPVPGGYQFVTATDFSQANQSIAFMAYEKIRELTGKNQSVCELFSGSGGISITLSKDNSVVASEISPRLVNLAARGSDDITVINMDVNEPGFINDLFMKNKFSVLVVNPPRTGLSNNLMEQICDSDIDKIVYMSCNVKTLASNSAFLKSIGNFDVDYVAGYDMFPDNSHFEVICTLIR